MELLREALPWLVHLTPEVRPMTAAERAQLTVQQRAWTTASVLLVYLVMCQLPLYGAHGRANDPLMTQRMIMGSSQGTVMELGIAPLLTSGLVTQLMASAGMLPTPPAATGKPAATRQRVEKTLGMLVCLGQAVLYVFVSGQYGHVKTTLGTGNALLLVGQLFGAGVAVILMDEVLALGYGLHPSGVSLFVAAHVCTEVVWKALSPISIFATQRGGGVASECYGALPALAQALAATVTQPQRGLHMLTRVAVDRGPGLPSLSALGASALVAALAVYLRQCRFDVALQAKTPRAGQAGTSMATYTVRLLYAGTMPVVLQAAAVGNVLLISQGLYRSHPRHALVKLLGVWRSPAPNAPPAPASGVAYYLTPPTSLRHLLHVDPLHGCGHVCVVCVVCAVMALKWVEITGADAQAVAAHLRAQQMVLRGGAGRPPTLGRPGGDRHTTNPSATLDALLGRVVPAATVAGAVCVGLLTLLGDVLHAAGGGSGLLLAVGALQEVWEAWEQGQNERRGGDKKRQ